MNIVDTHCHLYADAFDEDQDQVIEQAKKAGVEKIYLPNIDLDSVEPMKTLVQKDPDYFRPMMGLHPCSVKEDYKDVLTQLKKELDRGDYVAVGEIGIDLYWDKTHQKEQEDAFRTQIQWSIEKNLPFAIHVRNAFKEVFSVMDEFDPNEISGVFHCFTGDEKILDKCLSYPNFYIGIGGIVTFKNGGLDKVLKPEHLDKIVLETDAPYLAPTPKRGKRNEPALLSNIHHRFAEVTQKDLKMVAEITSKNAFELFS